MAIDELREAREVSSRPDQAPPGPLSAEVVIISFPELGAPYRFKEVDRLPGEDDEAFLERLWKRSQVPE